MRLRNLIRVTNIKFEVDEDSDQIKFETSTYVVFYLLSISNEFGSFLSVNSSINVVKTAIPKVSTNSNLKFLKIEHFNKLLSRSRRVLLSS